MEPRRSGRTVRLPKHNEVNIVLPDTNDEDPRSYKEAIIDTDKEKWYEIINKEMELMYFNSIRELVDLLERFRSIGNKWIYKRKKGPDEQVETYKARLVAKGLYTERNGGLRRNFFACDNA